MTENCSKEKTMEFAYTLYVTETVQYECPICFGKGGHDKIGECDYEEDVKKMTAVGKYWVIKDTDGSWTHIKLTNHLKDGRIRYAVVLSKGGEELMHVPKYVTRKQLAFEPSRPYLAFRLGRMAMFKGEPDVACPYPPKAVGYIQWHNGWMSNIRMTEEEIRKVEYQTKPWDELFYI
jgi:hypothetical protein